MTDFFSEFNKPSKQDWEKQLLAELKGAHIDPLKISSPIEQLEHSSYYHTSDGISSLSRPGEFPYTRGFNKSDNSWNNGLLVEVTDEAEANKTALNWLNAGVDAIVFKALKANIDWAIVLKDIQLEYIHSQFIIYNYNDFILLNEITKNIQSSHLNIDLLETSFDNSEFQKIVDQLTLNQKFTFAIHGFKLQQCGANATDELSFALASGHETLVKLLDAGLTIDEASACISFKLGIGSTFAYEVAKFRAFRELWAMIINAYSPTHECSHNCHITAVVGHTNKSLKDPHTNLLRQTTEALSAVLGGVDTLVILPYDMYSNSGVSELAQRMAINISNILMEESFIGKVIDPYGGSYNIEKITETLSEKAWNKFKSIESLGGISSNEAVQNLKTSISTTKSERIQRINDGKDILIGINKFSNPDSVQNGWKSLPTYLGLNFLSLEQEYKGSI